MKYLNEKIEVTIGLPSTPAKGMYRYDVQLWGFYNDEWVTLFTGNYYNSGTRWPRFDITELCRRRQRDYLRAYGEPQDTDNGTVGIYRVRAYDASGNTTNSSVFQVAHVYPYPNKQGSKMLPNSVFFDITESTKNDVSVLLQGSNRYRGPETSLPHMQLMPHFPGISDPQDLDYDLTPNFGITLEVGSGTQHVTLYTVASDEQYDDTRWGEYDLQYISYDDYCHTYFGPYKFLASRDVPQDISTREVTVWMEWSKNGVMQVREVARIDPYCKHRFYIMWQDRYGSYQSQPFDGKIEYTESITPTEIQNYNNKRIKSGVTVQPKWKLSSGWLKEDVFPYYESIYTSPTIKLWDNNTGTEYDVIVTDKNYTEKKFKNEKSMMNITLTLELSEKQNMTY